MIILIDWKPEKAIHAKIKDHDKVTASVRHNSLGAYQLSNDFQFEASADQRLETGAFKVVMEYNSYCVQCTSPLYLPFSKKIQRSVEPCHWQVTSQFIKFEPVPIYLELSFILLAKFLLFFMAILKAKHFKIQNFFTSFEKCEQKTHSLWTRD